MQGPCLAGFDPDVHNADDSRWSRAVASGWDLCCSNMEGLEGGGLGLVAPPLLERAAAAPGRRTFLRPSPGSRSPSALESSLDGWRGRTAPGAVLGQHGCLPRWGPSIAPRGGSLSAQPNGYRAPRPPCRMCRQGVWGCPAVSRGLPQACCALCLRWRHGKPGFLSSGLVAGDGPESMSFWLICKVEMLV